MRSFLFTSLKKLIIPASIGIVCVIGDLLGQKVAKQLVLAIIDNITHATVGALAMSSIASSSSTVALEASVCCFLSSIIDVDHFIEAKSFSLKNATKLQHRPFLHCTSVTVGISVILLISSWLFKNVFMQKLSWTLVAAFVTHHIRDSQRRGLWLWPFGSTAPLPYFLYITAEILFPILIHPIYDYTKLTSLTPSNPYKHVPTEFV